MDELIEQLRKCTPAEWEAIKLIVDGYHLLNRATDKPKTRLAREEVKEVEFDTRQL